jgi:hypothetical protein
MGKPFEQPSAREATVQDSFAFSKHPSLRLVGPARRKICSTMGVCLIQTMSTIFQLSPANLFLPKIMTETSLNMSKERPILELHMFCRHGLVFSDLGRCKRLSKSEGWTRSNQVFLRVHIPRQFFACCLGFPDSVAVDVY